jgi:Alginate export
MNRSTVGAAAFTALCVQSGFGATAQLEDAATLDAPPIQAARRPSIGFNRWQEDWSILSDPAQRTDAFDSLKYISLSSDDPQDYLSLGLNLRERFESVGSPNFGLGGAVSDGYLLDRLQAHADLRWNGHWQAFVQLEDVRAPGKANITPVDDNPLDLRQAFVTYTGELGTGTMKARVGRQEMAFDLQRFVTVRDGPSVRQALDAVWSIWNSHPGA